MDKDAVGGGKKERKRGVSEGDSERSELILQGNPFFGYNRSKKKRFFSYGYSPNRPAAPELSEALKPRGCNSFGLQPGL